MATEVKDLPAGLGRAELWPSKAGIWQDRMAADLAVKKDEGQILVLMGHGLFGPVLGCKTYQGMRKLVCRRTCKIQVQYR